VTTIAKKASHNHTGLARKVRKRNSKGNLLLNDCQRSPQAGYRAGIEQSFSMRSDITAYAVRGARPASVDMGGRQPMTTP
jgi:hypothetical protein